MDRSTIGDGLDPVLQFILLDAPVDPDTMQVIWEASEAAIPWAREDDDDNYQMVEHALLPEDALIEYRIFVGSSGIELTSLRHTREEDDDVLGVDSDLINDLPDGQYNIHAHLIVPERPNMVLMQRIDVSDEGAGEVADDDIDPETEIPTLEPGEGWSGNIGKIEPVGDPDHPGFNFPAISRWAVVPQQSFNEEFTVGVAAFHLYGIDRVEFSVDGGPWVAVEEMVENPRTKTDEYFVNLRANEFKDGKVVVRAIAYPHNGVPYQLKDLELFANAGATLDFPVIELDAGTHHLSELAGKVPKEGWLTIRPKPGVKKEDCIVNQIDRVYTSGNLRIQGVTITHDGGNDFLYGNRSGQGWVWLDDVKVVGNGRENATSWLVHLWGRQFYTDCDISKVRNVFHGGGGLLFARNVYIHDVYEDIFRSFGYVANVTVDGVDRGNTSHHPDIFEFATGWTQNNIIFQDVKVRKAKAQGFAGGNIHNVAFINCDVSTTGLSVMQIGHVLKNVLIQDSQFKGGARLRNAVPSGFVIRESKIGWRKPFLPDGWDQPGIEVVDHPYKLNK